MKLRHLCFNCIFIVDRDFNEIFLLPFTGISVRRLFACHPSFLDAHLYVCVFVRVKWAQNVFVMHAFESFFFFRFYSLQIFFACRDFFDKLLNNVEWWVFSEQSVKGSKWRRWCWVRFSDTSYNINASNVRAWRYFTWGAFGSSLRLLHPLRNCIGDNIRMTWHWHWYGGIGNNDRLIIFCAVSFTGVSHHHRHAIFETNSVYISFYSDAKQNNLFKCLLVITTWIVEGGMA